MASNRIVYHNWIVDLGRDPSQRPELNQSAGGVQNGSDELTVGRQERLDYLNQKVREALRRLSENERELIEQVHFMGRGIVDIASLTGRSEHRLEALHGRALRKLRRFLAPLVRELYGIGDAAGNACPVCRSPRREEIDRLIRERDRTRTWRPVMNRLRQEFDLKIASPQALIGHEKYH